MPVFRDTDELYQVLDTLFRRLSDQPDIARALLAGRFVLRFRYARPEGQVTVDLRGDEVRWEVGESQLAPDLELIQDADVAHEFWLGELNVPLALAGRRVVSRGDIRKALALLPAVKPAFPIYRQVLAELGMTESIPAHLREGGDSSLAGRVRARAMRLAAAAGLDRIRDLAHIGRPRGGAAPPEGDGDAFPIPCVESVDDGPAPRRESNVPAEEPALRLEMLSRMHVIRAFEVQLAALYADGRVPTEAIHLSIGQEATAVGACFALRPDDTMATTHRGHGHMLAKGAPADRMMAEIMGRADGLCGGKGGSMHVTDAGVGAIGANGIVGASPLIATGAAHAARLRQADQVSLAFLGDGATNQGMFHEALNFASVLRLPVVFVVENNQYGEFTALGLHTRVESLADRAVAYAMPSATVDGNDVWAVYKTVSEAVERARSGDGPTLIVADTYRWHGHMEGETADYRTAEEIEGWKQRCPIRAWTARVVEDGLVDAEGAEALGAEARATVEEALEYALASPEPDLEALRQDVFAPDLAELYRPRVTAGGEREISCSQALREALLEEMQRDPSVYLLGEDVARGGYFAVTSGLIEELGPDRIVDTPISEYAIVGSAVGAAMTGARPVAEILFSDFLTTCMDPLVNNAAKLRYMSGGQYRLPLVVRTPGGAGLGMAAQHSQSLEAILTGIPGLIVLAPGTAADAKGLLKAAIRSNNPVVLFENKLLYAATGPVPEGDHLTPIGVAEVAREGRDITLVSVGAARMKAMAAADELAREGIEVEVIDPRSLVPLDFGAIARSVARTGRLVTLEDAPLCHGFGAELVARVAERVFGALRAAPRRIAAADVPVPYAAPLERACLPDVARVVEAVRAVVRA